MKVLLRIRGDVDRFPGGDYIQLLQTRTALEKIGIASAVASGPEPSLESCDVVHLFNTTRVHETHLQYLDARQRGLPVVLSPIWHSLEDMSRCYRRLYRLPVFPMRAYLAAKELHYARRSRLPVHLAATFRFRTLQRQLIADCDAILPNSQAELDVLTREAGVRPAASFIVPHGFQTPPETAPTPAGERRDILCAGRIEPRKNQLAVIQAFKQLPRDGRRLLLFGAENTGHPGYVRRVRAECVEGWVEYGGEVPQTELFTACRRARVVVLMSFFETFGLAALEGLSCGATICLSDTAMNRGIYGDRAVYADPYAVDSIRDHLAEALRLPLKDHRAFLQQFTWEQAARETLRAYRHAISH